LHIFFSCEQERKRFSQIRRRRKKEGDVSTAEAVPGDADDAAVAGSEGAAASPSAAQDDESLAKAVPGDAAAAATLEKDSAASQGQASPVAAGPEAAAGLAAVDGVTERDVLPAEDEVLEGVFLEKRGAASPTQAQVDSSSSEEDISSDAEFIYKGKDPLDDEEILRRGMTQVAVQLLAYFALVASGAGVNSALREEERGGRKIQCNYD
jgi:hypothetical protein